MRMRVPIAAVLTLALSGCEVGPNYKRPAVDVPGQYRGLAPGVGGQTAGEPFGEMKWQSVFPDEVLQGLIKEALANNYDMRIAASRILQAQANVGRDPRRTSCPPCREASVYRTNVRQRILARLLSIPRACS